MRNSKPMQYFEKMRPGSYYHVYNRGINKEKMFYTPSNYQYFIQLFNKYVEPVASTYAWCLMPNHFHFLIRIDDPERVPYPYTKITDPSRAFSHLCNAYAQAFNKQRERTGSLFQTPFKRKLVTNYEYFQQLVYYIHNNPVKHGFVKEMDDYPWSSFKTLLNLKEPRSSKTSFCGYFNSKQEFIGFHNEHHDLKELFYLSLEGY
jgi:putative transposase